MESQKSYLMRNVGNLTTAGLRQLGLVLIDNHRASSLEFCSSGTLINLDTLDATVIDQLCRVMAGFLEA